MGFSQDRSLTRDSDQEISARLYVLIIGALTWLGLIACIACSWQVATWEVNLWFLIIVGFLSALVGIFITFKSERPGISLLGYVITILGFALILGAVIGRYKVNVVWSALSLTTIIAFVMSLAGIIYPKSLAHWGSILASVLLALIVVRFGQIILAALGLHSFGFNRIIDYIAVVLFSVYIVYDWNKAMRREYTLDNAVDGAAEIFIDVINIFIHILSLLGDSED